MKLYFLSILLVELLNHSIKTNNYKITIFFQKQGLENFYIFQTIAFSKFGLKITPSLT